MLFAVTVRVETPRPRQMWLWSRHHPVRSPSAWPFLTMFCYASWILIWPCLTILTWLRQVEVNLARPGHFNQFWLRQLEVNLARPGHFNHFWLRQLRVNLARLGLFGYANLWWIWPGLAILIMFGYASWRLIWPGPNKCECGKFLLRHRPNAKTSTHFQSYENEHFYDNEHCHWQCSLS